MTNVDLTFTSPAHPMSVNENTHWAKRRARLKPWHDAAWATARNHRSQAARTPQGRAVVPITVQVVIPFRRANRRDPHNYTGTVVKAVVDGIKDAGLVPDDTAAWVTVLDPEFVIVPDKSDPLTATVRIRPRETP